MWERLFGWGLVMPVDQMHSANPPSHPELLEWLARDTEAHGYDLRRLVRGLVLSRAYARDGRVGSDDPPRPSLFAASALRPLTASQLAVALRMATADPEALPSDVNAPDFDRRVEALAASAKPLVAAIAAQGGDGRVGIAEALSSITPTGSSASCSTRPAAGRSPDWSSCPTPTNASRWPSGTCSAAAGRRGAPALREYLEHRSDRTESACRQLVWALLASPEFRFNH